MLDRLYAVTSLGAGGDLLEHMDLPVVYVADRGPGNPLMAGDLIAVVAQHASARIGAIEVERSDAAVWRVFPAKAADVAHEFRSVPGTMRWYIAIDSWELVIDLLAEFGPLSPIRMSEGPIAQDVIRESQVALALALKSDLRCVISFGHDLDYAVVACESVPYR